MERLPGCGAGLAGHAPLPGQLAEVADAMANLLQVHIRALDPGETAGSAEIEAYRSLSGKYLTAGASLADIAREAETYRTLSPASHDMTFMTGPEPLQAFERLVQARSGLLHLLEAGREQNESMLQAMRASQSR